MAGFPVLRFSSWDFSFFFVRFTVAHIQVQSWFVDKFAYDLSTAASFHFLFPPQAKENMQEGSPASSSIWVEAMCILIQSMYLSLSYTLCLWYMKASLSLPPMVRPPLVGLFVTSLILWSLMSKYHWGLNRQLILYFLSFSSVQRSLSSYVDYLQISTRLDPVLRLLFIPLGNV